VAMMLPLWNNVLQPVFCFVGVFISLGLGWIDCDQSQMK
jgi:hypothetical protein